MSVIQVGLVDKTGELDGKLLEATAGLNVQAGRYKCKLSFLRKSGAISQGRWQAQTFDSQKVCGAFFPAEGSRNKPRSFKR